MSGISEERLAEYEQWTNDYRVLDRSEQMALLAEIRRLRAENKELRASYERVEKYGQILLIETGELKDELSLWKRNADR